MNLMRVVVAAVVLGLLVAGCMGNPGASDSGSGDPPSSNDDSAGDPESGSRTSDPVANGTSLTEPLDFAELLDCSYYVAGFQVPEPTVREHVPPEYDLFGSSEGLAQVSIQVLGCDKFTISNETVGAGLAFAAALVRVLPPEALAGEADVHFYAVETFASHEALMALFSSHGIPMHPGEVTQDRGPAATTVRVMDGADLKYELQGGYGFNDGSPIQEVQRNHFLASSGRPAWVDFSYTVQLPPQPGPVILTDGSGALADMWTDEPHSAAGIGFEGSYAATVTFAPGETP